MASLHLRRLVPAVLLAATAVLGDSAIGDPATACAEPNTGGEWDVVAYDECIARGTNARLCCSLSGGVWAGYPYGPMRCVAPPATPAEAQPDTAPGTAPGVATENPAPPLPPIRNPEITATFQPGPVGPVG